MLGWPDHPSNVWFSTTFTACSLRTAVTRKQGFFGLWRVGFIGGGSVLLPGNREMFSNTTIKPPTIKVNQAEFQTEDLFLMCSSKI